MQINSSWPCFGVKLSLDYNSLEVLCVALSTQKDKIMKHNIVLAVAVSVGVLSVMVMVTQLNNKYWKQCNINCDIKTFL